MQHYEVILTHQLNTRQPGPHIEADWHQLGDLYERVGNFAALDNHIKGKPTPCHYPVARQQLIAHGSKTYWNQMDWAFSRYLPSHRFPGRPEPIVANTGPSQETIDSMHEVLWWDADAFFLMAAGVGEIAEMVSLRVVGLLGAAAGFIKETVHIVRARTPERNPRK